MLTRVQIESQATHSGGPMTEEEAKTKFCPLMRIFPAGDFWVSTSGTEYPAYPALRMGGLTRCVGSGCMAWKERWGGDRYCGAFGPK